MRAEGKFLVYCLENYRREKNLTGKQVYHLFKRYGVTEYVMSCYDSLHTTGRQYTVEDIDEFIAARQSV
ncbi:MAG: DUF3791 domain-containing protein [Clostridiales bacterium]|nr:DUF3791 domain-containing protein [Clostridiales bacterium]